MLSALLAGTALGFSLIIAIGAQNMFVLRQGLRREHVVAVATVCAASDAALIAAGVGGAGAALAAVPVLVEIVRWAGAAFLACYGVLAARRALRPHADAALRVPPERPADAAAAPTLVSPDAAATTVATPDPSAAAAPKPRTTAGLRSGVRAATASHPGLVPVLATCLALTWLNPHVYLDTVLLLGTIAQSHGALRWAFGVGAAAASVVWFFGLASGARALAPLLARPGSWRILDGAIAVVMIAIAISLVWPH